jgi:hypothetical protein
LFGGTRRPEVVEIDTVADHCYRNFRDQPFEITFLDLGMNQCSRERIREMALIGEKTSLLELIDPSQRYPRPIRVLPPFERIEIAELHDPWDVRERLGELRNIGAIDDDQVRA